ncbi:hypothetical protein BD289DRAFT_275006 [Coniella lustricola]|uniref:Uncharacterized protein n=1 Tax=Coniella lustricola TaxID=2025994 RepID=A0A2T3A6R8_9PEZI|nr:hypothetical protein BD289DRAFT_275006 [Coniella lustricola]
MRRYNRASSQATHTGMPKDQKAPSSTQPSWKSYRCGVARPARAVLVLSKILAWKSKVGCRTVYYRIWFKPSSFSFARRRFRASVRARRNSHHVAAPRRCHGIGGTLARRRVYSVYMDTMSRRELVTFSSPLDTRRWGTRNCNSRQLAIAIRGN